LVYVSFGSVTAGGHLPFYPALYRAAIDALAPLPARFLLTVGEERDHRELGALPPNVTVERWVPQDEVLTHAAAVVTHGGHGTVIKALAADVPLLVLPMGRDQNDNATRVTERGAGLQLTPETASDAIAQATRRLLDEPSFAEAAAQLGARIRDDAAGDEAVVELEGLASRATATQAS
jgi:MGT family glycosyltransferase